MKPESNCNISQTNILQDNYTEETESIPSTGYLDFLAIFSTTFFMGRIWFLYFKVSAKSHEKISCLVTQYRIMNIVVHKIKGNASKKSGKVVQLCRFLQQGVSHFMDLLNI